MQAIVRMSHFIDQTLASISCTVKHAGSVRSSGACEACAMECVAEVSGKKQAVACCYN